MQKPFVVTGRLVGPKSVELDEPVSGVAERVEVIVHPLRADSKPKQSLSELLRQLPPGTRTRADIDAQMEAERDW